MTKLGILNTFFILSLLGIGFSQTHSVDLMDRRSPNKVDPYVLSSNELSLTHKNELQNLRDDTDSSIVELNFTSGLGSCFALKDNIAFTVKDRQIQILDLTNPASPLMLGALDQMFSTDQGDRYIDIQVENEICYILKHSADIDSLIIYNIASIHDPIMVNNFTLETTAIHMLVQNSLIYTISHLGMEIYSPDAESNYSLSSFFEISLPNLTSELHAIAEWWKISGEFALFNVNGGITIVDITDPMAPDSLYHVESPLTRTFDYSNGTLYFSHLDGNAIQLLDISDLSNVNEIAVYTDESIENISNIKVQNQLLYTLQFPGTLHILNIANPMDPQISGSCNFRLYPGLPGSYGIMPRMLISDSRININSQNLVIVEVSTPNDPQVYPCLLSSFRPQALCSQGEITYLVDTGAFTIVDYSDPHSPQAVNRVAHRYFETKQADIFDSKLIIVGDISNNESGLTVFDISNLEYPTPQTYLEFGGGEVSRVEMSGDHLFVLNIVEGLIVFDLTDPTEVVETSSFPHTGYTDMTFEGDRLAIMGEDDIKLFNISQPSTPSEMGSIVPEGWSRWAHYSFSMKDNILFIAGEYELSSYDISDLLAPVEIDHISWGLGDGFMTAFGLNESTAYVLSLAALRTIEISESGYFNETGIFHFEGGEGGWFGSLGARAMSIAGNHIVVKHDFGLHLLAAEVALEVKGENPASPARFFMAQNYPNPFNPTTTINYELPEHSIVKLTVFNVRGQEVLTLQYDEKPPGNYQVQWNGMDQSGNPVSTGLYFCRLQAGDYSHTIEMVYLR